MRVLVSIFLCCSLFFFGEDLSRKFIRPEEESVLFLSFSGCCRLDHQLTSIDISPGFARSGRLALGLDPKPQDLGPGGPGGLPTPGGPRARARERSSRGLTYEAKELEAGGKWSSK